MFTLSSQPFECYLGCVFPKLKKLGMWTKRVNQDSVNVGLGLDTMGPQAERCRSVVIMSSMEVYRVVGILTIKCQK